MEDLTSCILDFQANIIRVTYRKKTTLVDLENEPKHIEALDYIWKNSKLSAEDAISDTDEQGHAVKWRKLGFDSEDIEKEFDNGGVLALDCLVCVW
jgi:engulfment/cell motility protein 1